VRALRSLLQAFGWSQYLLPFIPIAVALEVAHADPVIVFAASALGVIPTA
jgi:Ca2+:H+ antiporter